MAFVKSIFFAAFIAVAVAQFDNLPGGIAVPEQITNATSGAGAIPAVPQTGNEQVDQLSQQVGGSTEAPAAVEEPNRLLVLADRVSNGLNSIRGTEGQAADEEPNRLIVLADRVANGLNSIGGNGRR